MITNKEFRFNVFVSKDSYKDKTESSNAVRGFNFDTYEKVKKMAFRDLNLTIDEFADYILKGYSYCNLFSTEKFEDKDKKVWYRTNKGEYRKATSHYNKTDNKGCYKVQFKQDKFFKGSYLISIDIDRTNFKSVEDYMSKLTYKPSFVYTSYSDSETNRKFRMVYLMDMMMDLNQFKFVSEVISRQIEADTDEGIYDDCGKRVSQYFNGTNHKENYRTYNVYNIADFDSSILSNQSFKEKKVESMSYVDEILDNGYKEKENDIDVNSKIKSIIKDYDLNKGESHNSIFDSGQICEDVETIDIDNVMVQDMRMKSYRRFLYKYGKDYSYFYRTEKEEWLENKYGKYQFTDENYISLYWNRVKVTDGNKRRKRLYSRAVLRRIMKPSITPTELLFNLYIDRKKFFDNSDGVLSIDVLIHNVELAFKKSIEELKNDFSNIIEISNKNRPYVIVKNENKMNRGESHNSIFDSGQILKQKKGLLNSILKKDKTKFDIELIKQYYNPEKSIRDNVKILKENNINIGRERLRQFINKYELNNVKNCPTINDNETNDKLYMEEQEKPLETKTEPNFEVTAKLLKDIKRVLLKKDNLEDDMKAVINPFLNHIIFSKLDIEEIEFGVNKFYNLIDEALNRPEYDCYSTFLIDTNYNVMVKMINERLVDKGVRFEKIIRESA